MKVNKKNSGYIIVLFVLSCAAWGWYGPEGNSDDWDSIWKLPMPEPKTVEVGGLGDLGEELENRKWLMVATEYHQIHYQQNTDKRKLAEIYSRIDNIYRFLSERSLSKAKTPIRVFLVPDEFAKSRCDRISNSMRTGDRGDVYFILTSLLHEETHLFNFAFLDNVPQGWWAGEFSCLYFQQRSLWQGEGKQVKQEMATLLSNGPGCHLSEISSFGKNAFNEAISVFYFLEEQYGREKMIELRKALLEDSLKTNGKSLSNSVFEQVFGKEIGLLEMEWHKFYEWESFDNSVKDDRLKKRISYSTDRDSVQNVVQEMARRADLGYNRMKSRTNTGELSRRWLYNIQVVDKPLEQALKEMLDPLDLTYKFEGETIVLYKK